MKKLRFLIFCLGNQAGDPGTQGPKNRPTDPGVQHLTPFFEGDKLGGDGFKAGMEAGFSVLAQSRQTAVNLFWALKRMRVVWDSVKEQNNIAVAQRLLVEAHEVFAEEIRINQAMGTFGAELLV